MLSLFVLIFWIGTSAMDFSETRFRDGTTVCLHQATIGPEAKLLID